jgi:hypothetical protein
MPEKTDLHGFGSGQCWQCTLQDAWFWGFYAWKIIAVGGGVLALQVSVNGIVWVGVVLKKRREINGVFLKSLLHVTPVFKKR